MTNNAASTQKMLTNIFDKCLEKLGEVLENLSVLVKDNQGCFVRDGSI